jgi:hypothetical protein
VTITREVVVLLVCSGHFLRGLATTYLAQREYQSVLNNLVGQEEARVQHNASLQYTIAAIAQADIVRRPGSEVRNRGDWRIHQHRHRVQ